MLTALLLTVLCTHRDGILMHRSSMRRPHSLHTVPGLSRSTHRRAENVEDPKQHQEAHQPADAGERRPTTKPLLMRESH